MACAGIDFGNKTSSVAIARRGGIDICVNEVSNRATPSMVSFQGKERHIGESAASIAAQNHRNTVASLQRLLGVKFPTPFSKQEASRLTCSVVSAPGTSAAAVTVDYDDGMQADAPVTFSFEALTAMLLSNLMATASAEYKAPVRDLVASVPVYYTVAQRQALLNAAAIANLNVLRVINEHASIALAYGIFRTKELPDSTPIKVAFADVGEASTTVSITAFTNTGCRVLSAISDASLGGRDLDDIIVRKFADQFKESYGIDVLSKPKPAARLRKECERIKKILSANPVAPINIECLMDDVDVKGSIKREDLEEIAAPLLDRIKSVCERAIVDANLQDGETLAAVEMVGGSSRVPAFKKVIGDVFSTVGASIRTTLNADECIARGCGLMSAMLSPAFKVREYNVADIATEALYAEKVFTDGTPSELLTLVPKGNPTPCLKAMKFKSPGILTIHVRYADPAHLPSVEDSAAICSYLINAPVDADAKVHAKVRVTNNGTVELKGAKLVKEVEVEEEVVVNPPAKAVAEKTAAANDSSNVEMSDAPQPSGNSVSEDQPALDEGIPTNGSSEAAQPPAKEGSEEAAAANKAEEPEVREVRLVKKKEQTDLEVTPLPGVGCSMAPEELQAATEKEAAMKANDKYIKERSEAMNSLEAYVYDLRSRIDDSYGDLKDFGPAAIRSALRKDLDIYEEWIYSEEAEQASKSAFVEKRDELVKKAHPLLNRKKEFDNRPVRIRALEAAFEAYKQVVIPESETYAHIAQEDKDKLMKCVESAAIWLKEERGKQDNLSNEVDPILTCAVLTAKLTEVDGVCAPIQNTPKPEPKVEKKEGDGNGVAGSGDDMETDKPTDTEVKKGVEVDPEAENPTTTANGTAGNDEKVDHPASNGSEAMEE